MDPSRLKKLNVLYAEDDESARESLKKSLDILCANIYGAKDGQEAIELFDSNKIDIAILDYVMPKKDAYEVLKHIRKHNENLPVIILSAYTDKEKLLNAINTKVVEYLEKPIELNKLIDSLMKHAAADEDKANKKVLLMDDIYYHYATKLLYRGSEEITLIHYEVAILEYFIQNRGFLVSKSALFELFDSISDGTLRNCISSLRKKLPPQLIETKKNLGYVLR